MQESTNKEEAKKPPAWQVAVITVKEAIVTVNLILQTYLMYKNRNRR